MILNDVILDALAILDDYSEDGVVTPQAEREDETLAAIRFADMGQKELYKIGRAQKTINIVNKPVKNAMGLFSNFDIVEFTGTDQYYPSEAGLPNIKSYYLEADMTHTAVIQELEGGVWTDLVTHSATVTSMTAYKANITPTTAGNYIRIKFTGTTYYRHVNRALYEYAFNSDANVPDYTPWVKYDLPGDFKAIDMVVEEFPSRQYNYSATYKFEQPDRFYYNYYFDGEIRIIYKPIPATLTSVDDVLQIDDVVAKALSFYVASWLSPYSNQSLTNPLFQKYLELKVENTVKDPMSEEAIVDVYGGFMDAHI